MAILSSNENDLKVSMGDVIGPFALLVFTTVALAMVNYKTGSLLTTPGTSFIVEGATLCLLYAAASQLVISRKVRGVSDPVVAKLRIISLALAVMSAPLTILLLAPAINGMAGLSEAHTERMVLENVRDPSRGKGGRITHYRADLSRKPGGALPSGSYILGSYGLKWKPGADMPKYGSEVEVTWRTGLLGKRTVLSALPVQPG